MDKITLEPLIESADSASGSREVILTIIEAGWGNASHNHYYPAETLERAAKDGVFDGVRMYADHLSEGQKRLLGNLPRSVKDLTGRILNTWYDSASRSIKGRAKLVPWFHDIVRSDPGLVEASINAGGRAIPRKIEGRAGRFVEAIVKAHSVDWVSVGGAGGKIDSLLEAHMEGQTHMYEDLTLDTLVEAKPALIAEILDSPLNERAATAEARAEAAEAKLVEAQAAPVVETPAPAEEIEPVVEAAAPVVVTLTEADVDARVQAILDAQAADKAFDKFVEAAVAQHSALPKSSQADIASEFDGKRTEFDSDEALTEAVDARCKSRIEQLVEAGVGRVQGLGLSSLVEGGDVKPGAKIDQLIDQRMGIDTPAADTTAS